MTNMIKKKSLYKKVVTGQIIFGFVLAIAISTVIGINYRHNRMNMIGDMAYNYAKATAEYVDGDSIQSYYETGIKDDYYYDVLNYLDLTQGNSDILYLYIFVPLDDGIEYIWDAQINGSVCELGQFEKYISGGKESVEKAFTKNPGKNITYSSAEDEYDSIAVAVYPIFDSKGEPVALVGVDLSMLNIDSEIIRHLIVVNICIFSIIIISILVVSKVINKIIVEPISLLKNATADMVDNLEEKKDIKIDIHSNDEFDDLARTYELLNKNICIYMDNLEQVTSEKERIASELNVATKIQSDMLPNVASAFPDRKDFRVYATMTPAKEVGGDFYDFFLIDEDHLALVIADVSGKGVPAALFMVIAKTLIKNRAMMGGSPAEILETVNNQLCEDNEEGYFVTVWLSIIDLKTGKAVASNAGHEYPVIKKKNDCFNLLKRKHSPALGAFDDVEFMQYEYELEAGDRVFVYTDGVPEATNSSEELFGMDRMLESLNKRQDETLGQIAAGVKSDIDKFVGEATQFDDMTMLCFDYYGNNN